LKEIPPAADARNEKGMAKRNGTASRRCSALRRKTTSAELHGRQQGAHIMISVNAIIISIMFSVLLGRLEYYPHLAIPALLLALVCVLTIVFSVSWPRGPMLQAAGFTEDDIRRNGPTCCSSAIFTKCNWKNTTGP
jgi:hypothetical protein